ncbi:hypothetical protein NLX85_14790 [Micromonospora sp. A3M-1-15]|uniref:hypothetical protein n=1 Tax=Micromonospora sp. A3M-1-15 TaxID=2962035 RepID=UPI0020B73A38|nr:hypothetical protein [Micromonospora sp. A3M-1-15]MCP3784638.1 hypothetical protein [Micromonospora sp. A3M-1-15]
MKRGATHADWSRYVRTVATPDGPVVLAPFVGGTWRGRGRDYRRRRRIATAAVLTVTLLAVALSSLFVVGLARPGTLPARLFASAYGLTVLAGLALGRRWVARAPTRPRWADDGLTASLGITIFLLVPVLAGFGIALLPSLIAADFPGERRARELTTMLRSTSASNR